MKDIKLILRYFSSFSKYLNYLIPTLKVISMPILEFSHNKSLKIIFPSIIPPKEFDIHPDLSFPNIAYLSVLFLFLAELSDISSLGVIH